MHSLETIVAINKIATSKQTPATVPTAHSGFHGSSGVQNHSCGPEYPVITVLIGSAGRSRVTLQGVSYDSDNEFDRKINVNRLLYAKRIADAAIAGFKESRDCGFTVASAGFAGCPDHGFLASYAEHEEIVSESDFGYGTVFRYALGHFGKLGLTDFIGGWADDGCIVLDVSKHFADRGCCVTFAGNNDQKAYYDCGRSISFPVSRPA